MFLAQKIIELQVEALSLIKVIIAVGEMHYLVGPLSSPIADIRQARIIAKSDDQVAVAISSTRGCSRALFHCSRSPECFVSFISDGRYMSASKMVLRMVVGDYSCIWLLPDLITPLIHEIAFQFPYSGKVIWMYSDRDLNRYVPYIVEMEDFGNRMPLPSIYARMAILRYPEPDDFHVLNDVKRLYRIPILVLSEGTCESSDEGVTVKIE